MMSPVGRKGSNLFCGLGWQVYFAKTAMIVNGAMQNAGLAD
jgi:hypothetical protein